MNVLGLCEVWVFYGDPIMILLNLGWFRLLKTAQIQEYT